MHQTVENLLSIQSSIKSKLVELNEKNESDAKNKIKQMCEKLLVNQIIEDFKIDKI